MPLTHNVRLYYFILFAFAGLLYANTLHHGFVLDDDVVLSQNSYVQQGIGGIPAIFSHDSFAGFGKVGEGQSLLEGGRYRPLSIAFFALIYSFSGLNPFPYHLFNVLLYGLAGLMVFKWILLLFKLETNVKWIALATSMLFIAHPLHTEVVANCKSADEILALLFGIGALFGMVKSVDTKSVWWMILSFVFMLTACLAKENAITFLLVAPLTLWFFRKTKIAVLAAQVLPIIAGGLVFLLIRHAVIGSQPTGLVMHDPLNNPFLEWTGNAWILCSSATKAATIIYTFGRSVSLLIFPYPLTHDYYPFHIQLQSFSGPLVWVSFIVLLLMMGFGLWSILNMRKAGYGLLFFLITVSITSNVFFPVGVFMAERFLFLPSLGVLLALVVYGFQLAGPNKQRPVLFVLGGVTVLFSILTLLRNPAWKDNETLLRTDIVHSPNSAKCQNDLGTNILDNALKKTDATERSTLLAEAYPHLVRATTLQPTYYDAYLASGACAYYLQQYDRSVDAYRTALKLYPEDAKSRTGLLFALQAYGRDQWSKHDTLVSLAALTEAWNMQPDTAVAADLSRYYEFLGQPDKAREWREKVLLLHK